METTITLAAILEKQELMANEQEISSVETVLPMKVLRSLQFRVISIGQELVEWKSQESPTSAGFMLGARYLLVVHQSIMCLLPLAFL